jgi:hypothetical protein
MPSPGRQRGGGSKSGQSGPRGGGRKGVGSSGQSGIDKSPGYKGRDKGSFPLGSRAGYEDRADVRAKPSASANPPKYGNMTEKEKKAERKAMAAKSGPVKSASKAQKQRMQRTLAKQDRKKAAAKESRKRQIKSDSSKTPGETKPKRTGGGGTRLAPRIGGSPYKRTTISQRIRNILE